MPDRPILFSAPMVRALLAGTKTQTRRVLKVPGIMGGRYPIYPPEEAIELGSGEFRSGVFHYASAGALSGPYSIDFAVGDRLWVKETWRTWRIYDEFAPTKLPALSPVFHEADRDNCDRHGKARVSIHMPRWASRLTLTVTDVRVERLQDISRGDAIAEGLTHKPGVIEPDWWMLPEPLHQGTWLSPVAAYRFLWDSINGPGAWDANPWVVAVSFDVREGNIDD